MYRDVASVVTTTVEVGRGRRVGVAEFGKPEGVPCLYLHGTASSRAEGALLDTAARARGVRLVALDRPGAGASDPLPGRTLLGWAGDLLAVADALGLGKFTVAGLSGGASHALACAYAAPERVRRAVLINPATPAGAPGLNLQQRLIIFLCQRAPWVVRWGVAPAIAAAAPSGDKLRDPARRARLLRFFPAVDRPLLAELVTDPVFRDAAIAACGDTRPAAAGIAQDLRVLWGAEWGFDPTHVTVPLELFAGAQDSSLVFCDQLANSAPDATLHVFPGGHHGFLASPVRNRVLAAAAQMC